jgi:hypothetical protein
MLSVDWVTVRPKHTKRQKPNLQSPNLKPLVVIMDVSPNSQVPTSNVLRYAIPAPPLNIVCWNKKNMSGRHLCFQMFCFVITYNKRNTILMWSSANKAVLRGKVNFHENFLFGQRWIRWRIVYRYYDHTFAVCFRKFRRYQQRVVSE